MGMQDILIGYIAEADPGHRGNVEEKDWKNILSSEIRVHNRSAISQLPVDDHWPPLSCKMFNDIPDAHLLTYKNSIIVFGGSFKMIITAWPEWLTKFENFLK